MLLADDGTHGVCALQIKQLNELRASERARATNKTFLTQFADDIEIIEMHRNNLLEN